MILKGFKEKSIKKYINKTLGSRKVMLDNSKIKTIGVLLNDDEAIDLKWFETLAKTLKINPNNFQVVSFTKEKKLEEQVFNNTYNEKSIGWKGKVKHPDLKRFIDTDFDVFISYYSEDSLLLNVLTAISKAKFKVGVFQIDERLNDLIIKTEVKDFETFKNELIKYLTILNKI